MRVTNVSPSWEFFQLTETDPLSVMTQTGAVGLGQVSFNFFTNCLQVNDGHTWREVPVPTVGVGLTPRAQQALIWAESAMLREQQRDQLEEQYPALKEAREHYETLLGLVQNQ